METLSIIGAYLFGTTILITVAFLGWLATWAMLMVVLSIPFIAAFMYAKLKRATDARLNNLVNGYMIAALVLASPASVIAPIKLYQSGSVPGYNTDIKQPPVVGLKSEVRRYKLLAYNPPKHFYVDLKDIQTGQLYERTYVSKHCNRYQDLELGGEYNLRVTTKQQGEKTWLVFDNLYEELCS